MSTCLWIVSILEKNSFLSPSNLPLGCCLVCVASFQSQVQEHSQEVKGLTDMGQIDTYLKEAISFDLSNFNHYHSV